MTEPHPEAEISMVFVSKMHNPLHSHNFFLSTALDEQSSLQLWSCRLHTGSRVKWHPVWCGFTGSHSARKLDQPPVSGTRPNSIDLLQCLICINSSENTTAWFILFWMRPLILWNLQKSNQKWWKKQKSKCDWIFCKMKTAAPKAKIPRKQHSST